MNHKDNQTADELRPMPTKELLGRVAWIGIRLLLVIVMANEFQPFFYQAF